MVFGAKSELDYENPDEGLGWTKKNTSLFGTLNKSFGRIVHKIVGGPKFDAKVYANYRDYLVDLQKIERDFYQLIRKGNLYEAAEKSSDKIVKAILTESNTSTSHLLASEHHKIPAFQFLGYVNIAALASRGDVVEILLSVFKKHIQDNPSIQALIAVRLTKENLDQRHLSNFIQAYDLEFKNPDAMITIWSRYCTFDPFHFIRYYIAVPFSESKNQNQIDFSFYDKKARRKEPDFSRNTLLIHLYRYAKNPCAFSSFEQMKLEPEITGEIHDSINYILWKTHFIHNSSLPDACSNYIQVRNLFASWYDPSSIDPSFPSYNNSNNGDGIGSRLEEIGEKHLFKRNVFKKIFASGLDSLLEVTIKAHDSLSKSLLNTIKHDKYSIWNYEIPFTTVAMILRTIKPSIIDDSINHPLFQSSVAFNMLRYFYIIRMVSFPILITNICDSREEIMKEVLDHHFNLLGESWENLNPRERVNLIAFIADFYFGVHSDVTRPIFRKLNPMEHLNEVLKDFY